MHHLVSRRLADRVGPINEPMTIAGLGLNRSQQSLYGLFMDQLAWSNSWDARFQLT